MSDPDNPEIVDPALDPVTALPTKVCPRCSVQSSTSGSFCPHCGAPFARDALKPRRSRRLLVAALIAVLAIAGGGIFLKIQSDSDAEASRAAAAQEDALEEAVAAAAAEAEEEAAAQAAEEAAEAERVQAAADTRERATRAEIV